MIRKLSSSSSLVDFDHFSEEIAFAERSPDEPEFGSAKKLPPVPILSYPSPLRSQSPSSCVSTDTHNDISGPSLKAKLSSTSLRNKPAKTVPRPWDNPSADFQPYSLMGAGGNLRYKWYAPTAPDLVYDRRPKPKPKPKPVAKTPSPSPVMEKSSKLSLKRVRLLGYRRSLTSSDFTNLGALAGMSDSASSTTTLVSEGRKSNDYGSQERKSRDIPPEDKDESDSRITTHHVVGNVWEEKDMSDVIPALRLLRVAGNLKL
ncbi:hypothetical protein EW026_g5925 [Hermanssonia centrifuga]|uniref:Uncharacterized protein n=1 Tax=Hermanssonia centrifuga TaxID=98765 RepID=A0A4S4KCU2_9APHY|nr:hypothetical protein EW026_g5925 [Hermanssonia centrifuga]